MDGNGSGLLAMAPLTGGVGLESWRWVVGALLLVVAARRRSLLPAALILVFTAGEHGPLLAGILAVVAAFFSSDGNQAKNLDENYYIVVAAFPSGLGFVPSGAMDKRLILTLSASLVPVGLEFGMGWVGAAALVVAPAVLYRPARDICAIPGGISEALTGLMGVLLFEILLDGGTLALGFLALGAAAVFLEKRCSPWVRSSLLVLVGAAVGISWFREARTISAALIFCLAFSLLESLALRRECLLVPRALVIASAGIMAILGVALGTWTWRTLAALPLLYALAAFSATGTCRRCSLPLAPERAVAENLFQNGALFLLFALPASARAGCPPAALALFLWSGLLVLGGQATAARRHVSWSALPDNPCLRDFRALQTRRSMSGQPSAAMPSITRLGN